MRKFLIKTLILLLAASGIFLWLRADASVLAGTTALGLDDSSGFLAANSQDPAPFNLLEASRTGYARVDLPFNEVSITPGTFVWAYQSDVGYKDYQQLFSRLDKRGIRPVVVLSGGPVYANHLYPQQPVFRDDFLDAWASYLRAAVQQFGGLVDYWQVGNLINDPAAWGLVVFPGASAPLAAPDAALYGDMLKIAYTIIKGAQSTDTILLGSLTYGGDCAFHPVAYLQALNDQNAWYAFDAVSLELPALNQPPEIAGVNACGYTPAQSSGKPVVDALRAVDDLVREMGEKPVWVHGLAIENDFLALEASRSAAPPEALESDLLTRASALLLAEGGAERIFWEYDPSAGKPGLVALQSFANLNQTLGGSIESGADALAGGSLQTMRFRSGGRFSVIAWRTDSGHQFVPTVITGFEGVKPVAWSCDAASLKNRAGIALPVDAGGSVALMLGERPVIIRAKPQDLKGSLSLLLRDSASQAAQGLKGKLTAFMQAQKAKAADQVSAWVEEQQQSLMDSLKDSFNQWLRKRLGLAKL